MSKCEYSSLFIRKLTQQATFFGLLIGVIFAGLLSDRFGRIPSMLFLIGPQNAVVG